MRQRLLKTLLVYLACIVLMANSQDPSDPFEKFIRRDPRIPRVPDVLPDIPDASSPQTPIIVNPIKLNFKIINYNSVLALDEEGSSQAQNEAPGPEAKFAADSKKKI